MNLATPCVDRYSSVIDCAGGGLDGKLLQWVDQGWREWFHDEEYTLYGPRWAHVLYPWIQERADVGARCHGTLTMQLVNGGLGVRPLYQLLAEGSYSQHAVQVVNVRFPREASVLRRISIVAGRDPRGLRIAFLVADTAAMYGHPRPSATTV